MQPCQRSTAKGENMNPIIDRFELTTSRIQEIRHHLHQFLSSELSIELNTRKLDEKTAVYLGFDSAYALFQHGKLCDQHAEVTSTPNTHSLICKALQNLQREFSVRPIDDVMNLKSVDYRAGRAFLELCENDEVLFQASLNEVLPFIMSHPYANQESTLSEIMFSDAIVDMLPTEVIRPAPDIDTDELAISISDLRSELSMEKLNRILLKNEASNLLEIITFLAAYDLAKSKNMSVRAWKTDWNDIVQSDYQGYVRCLNKRIKEFNKQSIPQLLNEKLAINDELVGASFNRRSGMDF